MAKDECITTNADPAELVSRTPSGSKAFLLTRELFLELDAIARIKGGCVIQVETPEETRGAFGYYPELVTGVFIDDRITNSPGCATEVPGVVLCNQIDLERFASQAGTFVDYSRIPGHLAYHFLTWFLIGVRLHGIHQLDLIPAVTEDRETTNVRRRAQRLNLALAEQFAWNALFPEQPDGFATDPSSVRAWLQAELELVGGRFEIRTREPRPLPCGEHEYVSCRHVKLGIPWADPAVEPIERALCWEGFAYGAPSDQPHSEDEFGAIISAGFFDLRAAALQAAEALSDKIGGIGFSASRRFMAIQLSLNS